MHIQANCRVNATIRQKMSEENQRVLKKYLVDQSPCLLEAIRLAQYIFANVNDDDKYDLVFVVMDYVHDSGTPFEEIASQCLYTSRDQGDLEFAGATLYWLNVQNEIGLLSASGCIEATNDRDAARMVADKVRGAAGRRGGIGKLVDAFVSHGVVGNGEGFEG